ncbi:MBL fold metallo-hydrolase [Ruminococcaceae bacterium OttesenSCG-928-O06]|nr:MBL fold metallo-hydrolase [Ruminococcaceae bacterium OttesenSCG-928-O06]
MIRKINDLPEIWSIDIPLPDNPLKNLNCYVVKSRGECLVIDTGFRRPECAAALNEGLEELGLTRADTSLFLTHLHADHTGQAAEFSAAGCTVYIGEKDGQYLTAMKDANVRMARFIEEGFPPEEMEMQFSRNPAIIYAAQYDFPMTLLRDKDIITVGDVELQCVFTPGHTPGHMCLYIPKNEIMFLGDHVLFDITPNITTWPNVENSLKDYRNSLDAIAKYPIRLALPAHRGNDMDVYQRIADIQAHHDMRLQNSLDIIAESPGMSAYEIASRMTWSMRGKTWPEFPVFQKFFAVGETIAHLDYLLAEGRLQKQRVGDVFLYRPA